MALHTNVPKDPVSGVREAKDTTVSTSCESPGSVLIYETMTSKTEYKCVRLDNTLFVDENVLTGMYILDDFAVGLKEAEGNM